MQRVLLSLFLVIVLVMMVCSFLLFSSLLSGPQTAPRTTNSSLSKAAPSPTALPTPTIPPTALPTPTPTQLPTPLSSPTIVATPTIPPTPTPTPIVNSTSAFLLDDATGKVLFEKNSHLHLPIASTTKIMTAIIAIENANNLNQIVTIQQSELDEVPQGMSLAYLRAGDRLKLQDLLYGLLLPSGSDAAVVIAHTIGGTTPNFVAMMNAKAQVLQLADTHFSNPHGFSVPNHYSSAADLTSLARYAMQNPTFTQIVAQQSYTIPGTLTTHVYSWSNGNHLLATYQGMDGVKTGTSDDAGYCLVFSARRNGRHLLGAELNATPNTLFPDVTRLLDMGFANAF